MSSVVKFICLVALFGCSIQAHARDLYILVIGEGAAANCNMHIYGEAAGVFQIGLDGNEKPARDPLDWADCKGGSIWIPVGQELIRQGMANKVVFMPVALSGLRARDLSAGGSAAGLLGRAIDAVKAKNIRFDYAFWQQGFSDSSTASAPYSRDVGKMIKEISLKLNVDRWLFAQGDSCTPNGAPQIAAVYKEMARTHYLNRFAGPDYDTFTSAELGAGCTFTAAGQVKAARLWVASMRTADVIDQKFQKESLLYYFK